MANSVFCQHVSTQLKEHFNTSMYSDITLKITETGTTAAPIEIKAHRLILSINSPYFKKLLAEREMNGEKELGLEVKPGEAQHVQTIVSSFYEKDVIAKMSIPELICVLESAFLYASEDLVEEICQLLDKSEPDFRTSNLALERFYFIERNDEQSMEEKLMFKVKSKFTKFLSEYFHPLEERIQTHTDFLSLFYGSLWCLIESDCSIACTENSLLMFILEWLEHNPDRQTSDNIRGLLEKIRVKFLNGTFLHELITYGNVILNKWDGFPEWIFNCLGYLVRRPEHKTRLVDVHNTVDRNPAPDPHAWFVDKQNKYLPAVRWMVRMSAVEEGKRFEPTPHILLRDGVKYSPESIVITPTEDGDGTTFDLTLKITSSFSMLGDQFVLGIVPADRDYDMSKMYFNSEFARSFLKWTESVTVEGTTCEFRFWCASKEFVDLANKVGLFVCMLPVVEQEYQKLSTMAFRDTPPKPNIFGMACAVLPKAVHRGQNATFQGNSKIMLLPASNYSV